jgi:protein-disulfide isomerase
LPRIQFLVGLLALGMAVGCKAQTTPQPLDPALNHEIVVIVRAQLNASQDTQVTVGARKPSQIPGFDTLPITLSNGGRSQVTDFLISTDNKTLSRLDSYNLAHYPLFDVAGRPIRGNPAAPVTVVSFDDLQCPYCAMMHQTLFPATLEHYKDKVRFVYKDNPLNELHPWAMHAAVDANCLAAQSGETYWAYVDYVHSHGQEVNGETRDKARSLATLDRIARQEAILAKLDLGTLDACLAKQDESQVRASGKEADSLEIEGAPALFVDGVRIGGAVPEAQLWIIIDGALRAAGVEPPATLPQPAPSQTSGTAK